MKPSDSFANKSWDSSISMSTDTFLKLIFRVGLWRIFSIFSTHFINGFVCVCLILFCREGWHILKKNVTIWQLDNFFHRVCYHIISIQQGKLYPKCLRICQVWGFHYQRNLLWSISHLGKKRTTVKISQYTTSKKDLCFSYITEAIQKAMAQDQFPFSICNPDGGFRFVPSMNFLSVIFRFFLFRKKVKVENRGKLFTIGALLVGG